MLPFKVNHYGFTSAEGLILFSLRFGNRPYHRGVISLGYSVQTPGETSHNSPCPCETDSMFVRTVRILEVFLFSTMVDVILYVILTTKQLRKVLYKQYTFGKFMLTQC